MNTITQTIKTSCPVCESTELNCFYKTQDIPVNSCLQLRDKSTAKQFICGDLALTYCAQCAFIFNAAFDISNTEYSADYEETQGFSPTFSQFQEELANRLIKQYGIKEKSVIEIGCGKGEFLYAVCQLGNNKGLGFDPAFIDNRLETNDVDITFIKDFYDARYQSHKADFYICKMTLEHIDQPRHFIHQMHTAIGENSEALVFIQIPDASRIVDSCAFEDIYYEHCNYFTKTSLTNLFQLNGFEILDIDVEYDNQYLTLIAKPSKITHKDVLDTDAQLAVQIQTYQQRWQEKQQRWDKRLQQWQNKHQKVVIWGGGSKAVAFFSSLKNTAFIQHVIDINPHREGSFLPKFARRIEQPQFLEQYQPDIVIIMNSIYEKEITETLRLLDLSPEIYCL